MDNDSPNTLGNFKALPRLRDSETVEGGYVMAYVNPNYKSKKEFKEAVARGVKHYPYNPSGMFPEPTNGRTVIEGPHYPQPHKWYASVEVKDGIVTSVK